MLEEKNYTPWYIGGGILVLIIILIVAFGGKSDDSTGIPSLSDRQQQLENDPKLAANVNSERNNFDPGAYSLDEASSSIKWEYAGSKGTIPVTGGSLVVVPEGRVGEFTVTANALSTTVDKGENAKVKNFISENGKDITMKALTVLPNTNDDAFTVAFILNALGKESSLATGMYVEKLEQGVKVRGDIYLDAKTVLVPAGFADATENMKLTVEYMFK